MATGDEGTTESGGSESSSESSGSESEEEERYVELYV